MQNSFKWQKRALICATILGICAIFVLAVLLLDVLATPVSIIIWTTIFVFLLRGIVNKCEKKGLNRVFGTIIAYAIMIAVILVVLLFMFSPVFGFAEQVQNIIENIPSYIDAIMKWGEDLYSQFGYMLQDQNIQKWISDAGSSLSAMGGNIAAASATGIISVGAFFGSFFMALGIALVVAFWILIELPAIGKETKKLIPKKFSEDAKTWQVSCTHVMAGFIKGTFLQCFIIGVISGLIFWLVGVPNPGAIGCFVGVINIIPIFGPILASIIALVSGLFNSVIVAIISFLAVSAIQGFVYTFVSPKIMSSACNIHPVLTLICLTAGGAIGGTMSGPIGSLVGMLLAIPFVAVFKSMFIYYYEKRTGVCIVSDKGFIFSGKPYDEKKTCPICDALQIQKGQEDEYLGKGFKPTFCCVDKKTDKK